MTTELVGSASPHSSHPGSASTTTADKTLIALFREAVEAHQSRIALRSRTLEVRNGEQPANSSNTGPNQAVPNQAIPNQAAPNQTGWGTMSWSTYGLLRERFAATLIAWGVQAGDRVGILSENRWEWHVSDVATLMVGAVSAPIYPTSSVAQVNYILGHCGARLCIASDGVQVAKIAEAAANLPLLTSVVSFTSAPCSVPLGDRIDVVAWADAVTEHDDQPDLIRAVDERANTLAPADLATIVYTSGTTGPPKGVLLSHGNITAHFDAPPPRLLRSAVERFEYRILDRLVGEPIRKRLGLDRARALFSGAAPIDPDLLRWLRGIGLDVGEVYGQTEVCGPTTISPLGDTRIGSVGKPVPGLTVMIAEDGEILVQGPNVCMGYYRNEQATRDLFDAGGWMRTGDLGTLDADGFLRITGRKKDLMKTAQGKYVAPQELELRLSSARFIAHAMVVADGRPYVTALLMLDPDAVVPWAQHRGKSPSIGTLADQVDAMYRAPSPDQVDAIYRAPSPDQPPEADHTTDREIRS